MTTRRSSNYWIWRSYSGQPGLACADEIEGIGDEVYVKLIRGHRLPKPLPRIRVTAMSEGIVTDLLGSYDAGYLVSPVLRAILEVEAAEFIQLIPVQFASQPRLSYDLLNVLSSHTCLDRERAVFAHDSGEDPELYQVKRMAISAIPENAPKIFHMAEFPALVLIHNNLKEKFSAACEFPGIFIAPESYPPRD